jgi:hypothetical protein
MLRIFNKRTKMEELELKIEEERKALEEIMQEQINAISIKQTNDINQIKEEMQEHINAISIKQTNDIKQIKEEMLNRSEKIEKDIKQIKEEMLNRSEKIEKDMNDEKLINEKRNEISRQGRDELRKGIEKIKKQIYETTESQIGNIREEILTIKNSHEKRLEMCDSMLTDLNQINRQRVMLTIVTGSDSKYFIFLRQLLDNVTTVVKNKFHSNIKVNIVVYDLGLTDEESEKIKLYPDIIVEKFNFSLYPEHVSLEKYNGLNCNYSWKPIIIQEVCEKYNNMIYWIDTQCLLSDFTNLIDILNKNYIYTPISSGLVSLWTHETTLKYMDAYKYTSYSSRSAGVFAINYNIEWCKELVKEWKNLALIKECICPEGSDRSNHRQDQAILSILYHKYQEKHRFKIIDELVGIKIHQSLDEKYM